MPSPPVPPVRSARTIHAFLIASTLIVSIGALVASRSTGALRGEAATIDYVGAGIGLAAALLLGALRRRLPARSAEQNADDWWRLQIGRAVLLWGLLELLAVLGAAALLFTGHAIGFAVLALLALGGLLVLSPARLAGE